ncbi:MAG: hypothetical protein ABIO45_00155 [Burkholderiaceae bacterium]
MTPTTQVRPLLRSDRAAWSPLCDGYNAFYSRSSPTARPEAVTQSTWERFFDLGKCGVQTFAKQYGGRPCAERPTRSQYFWRDPQGDMVGTDDPSVNPNVGSTGDWRKMERVGR